MKKIVKRLVSLTCVAALAATCCVGASAKSYYGKAGSFDWTASISLLNQNTGAFNVTSKGAWPPVYASTVAVKANYDCASGPNWTDGWKYAQYGQTSISYDCIHTFSVSNQSSQHQVSVNGYSDSVSLYL